MKKTKKQKPKFNLAENWKRFMSRARKMNDEEIKNYKFTMMFLIVADMVGLYWFLEMKKLGSALLIVFLVILAFLFMLERDLPEKPVPPKKLIKTNNHNTVKKEVKKMDNEDVATNEKESADDNSNVFGNFNLGIDAEGYQERMDEALGVGF